jgi:hypothetical protein
VTPRRRGFVLPIAMIAMLVAMLIVGSMHFAAWRAMRGTRSQWDAQQALYASNAAVVTAIATWDALSMAQQPIGATRWTSVQDHGWRTETGVARTSPLIAVVTAHTIWNADPSRVRRAVTRIVHLAPLFRPIAAVGVFDSLALDRASIDGVDRAESVDPLRDDCGPYRDTASVDMVARVAPATRRVALESFDSSWTRAVRLTSARPREADGSVSQRSAWEPVRVVADSAAGAALGVTLTGASRVQGVLLVDGDLVVRGRLRLDGLLVVRGALRVDAGELQVDGAVLVRDIDGIGSMLGPQTRVRWAPCLVNRALVALASPQRAPFHQWHSP